MDLMLYMIISDERVIMGQRRAARVSIRQFLLEGLQVEFSVNHLPHLFPRRVVLGLMAVVLAIDLGERFYPVCFDVLGGL